jgi:hypothetical protein
MSASITKEDLQKIRIAGTEEKLVNILKAAAKDGRTFISVKVDAKTLDLIKTNDLLFPIRDGDISAIISDPDENGDSIIEFDWE